MSDTASAVHHADLPMSATLGPRRPLGDIARGCVDAIVGGDSSQMSLLQCMDSLTGGNCGLLTSFSHLTMAGVLGEIVNQAGVPFREALGEDPKEAAEYAEGAEASEDAGPTEARAVPKRKYEDKPKPGHYSFGITKRISTAVAPFSSKVVSFPVMNGRGT